MPTIYAIQKLASLTGICICLVEQIPEMFTESRFLSDITYVRLDENTSNAFTPVPAGFVAFSFSALVPQSKSHEAQKSCVLWDER